MLFYIIRVYAMRALLWLLGAAAVLALAAAGALYFFFGGGEPYRDMTKPPLQDGDALQPVLQLDRPPGDIAVAADGRIFYTIHPEADPSAPMLMVARDGESVPFPAPERQRALFRTPLGLDLDDAGRLWVIDGGGHGLDTPRLVALDIDTGEVAHSRDLSDVAPPGSYLLDLQVDAAGGWVYVADAGFWARRPGLIVYDVASGRARRVLNRHETVTAQDLVIRNPARDMRYLGGLVALKLGASALALSDDEAWLYYAATSHSTLYRVPTALLQQPNLPHVRLAVDVETVALKPLSAGLAIDPDFNVFITDVERRAVHRFNDTPPGSEQPGRLVTLLRDERLRWPGALAFGPDGWLYLADSALPDVLNRTAAHVAASAPYTIWRFRPDATGANGAAPQTPGG